MDQGEGQLRRVPRYPFSAPVSVIPESGTPVDAKVTELSLYGCYLYSTTPLNPHTRVLVKIFAADGEYFEANATVIYSGSNLGMALVFRQVNPQFLTLLRKWLLKAMQQSPAEGQNPSEGK
jgi:hypothetical protein